MPGTKRARPDAEPLPSQERAFKPFQKRKKQNAQPGAPRGVSKIKSDLRQTKRLLSKDNLTPDVRTVTERRLVALEQELEASTQSTKERKLVLKYKKIKFFDRTKIERRINKAKKALKKDPSDAKAKDDLFKSRVDLYYVNRFPKDQKYVALFPEGNYVPLSNEPVAKKPTTKESAVDAAYVRDSRRRKIMQDMENGTLRAEAELDSSNQEHEDPHDADDDHKDEPAQRAKLAKGGKKAKADKEQAAGAAGIEGDDFFAD